MRYGNDADDIEAARRKHADQEHREWMEDRRVSERMWKEGEARRAQQRWDSTKAQVTNWEFVPITEESGRSSGWTVFLNGRKVGIIISVRNDLVVITSEDGGADVHYVRGSETISPDANQIMAAFQRQLPAGERR